jgi:3-methyl-2-oxobutanoate hydroxymethyltransferase
MKIDALKIFKQRSEKITCLTAYDASFSSVFDQCGVDIILVGDSLGNR